MIQDRSLVTADTSRFDHADATPGLFVVGNDFDMRMAHLEFPPERVNFAARLGWMLNDVMESDQTLPGHQGPIHLPISFHASISMVAVYEEDVQHTVGQDPPNALHGSGDMRIDPEQVHTL